MISKHAPWYFISRPLSLIIFNHQKSILFLFFFLKRARPDSIDRAVGLGHFEFKLCKNPPLLRSYYKNENFFFGEWPILRAPASKEPSRGHQGQVSIIATCQSLMAGNDPQEHRSATRGGVGTAVPQTPRAISWHARVGNEPEASPVWLLALATSAAQW